MKTKLLILALLVTGMAQSQNLLQNGSFENFTATTPNSWTLTYGTSDKESTTFSDGASSLKAVPTSPQPFFTPIFWATQDFTLSDTETYTVKFDYFIAGTLPTNYISRIGFELSLINQSDAYFFPQNYPSTPVVYGSWKTVTFDFKILQFKAPATSAALKLTLQAGADNGSNTSYVYFDNVSIVKKASLGTVDFDKKSNPIAYISKNEIKLNSDYKDSSYVIYSVEGKAVKRAKNNSSESIDTSELTTGVYFLKLNDASTSVKFIKQ
ncbi:T9SS type A sorting domain-containing protein [Flavobacterium sp. T12S277]|uniref:T9SS type A sorting domain-containing protein n=1 Tax=Flavobacterium sp. T12S277 TaxID=3402752 RepID=UPI003AE7A6FB